MLTPSHPHREVCLRCRRPAAVCYCPHLVQVASRTRVVFLQHPREARVPIGTARMAHLMLENSELHCGVRFDDHPRVRELAADPSAVLLFPGPGSMDPLGPAAAAVRTVVVVDGTWQQARKVLRESSLLGGMPRLGLLPDRPGNYRIRREPAPECLATVEAVSQVLGALDGAPARFSPMLAAFTFMVDEQLARAASRTSAPRRRRATLAGERLDESERAQLARAVLVHGEVNAHPRDARAPGRPELLHLVAHRLEGGEVFDAIIAPRRPLSPAAPARLCLEVERLLAGEPAAAALRRFSAFLRPGDVLCGWGRYVRDSLAAETDALADDLAIPSPFLADFVDLRGPIARRLQGGTGTPAQAARALGAEAEEPRADASPGRAGATVAVLRRIAEALARSLAPSA